MDKWNSRKVRCFVIITWIGMQLWDPRPVWAGAVDNEGTVHRANPGEMKSAERIVTWRDIVKLVDSHPGVIASRHAIEAAAAARDAAKAAPNPSLEAEAAYARAKDGSDSGLEWGLGLSMPFTWIAERRSKMSGAKADVQVAEAEAEAIRREVLSSLQILFWDLVDAQARTEALEALETETRALLGVVQKQVETGEVRPIAVVRVEIEVEKIASEVEAARTMSASKQARLALLLGIKEETLVAAANLNETLTVPALDVALAKMRETHPELAVAKARVRSLEAAVKTEKAARVPSFSVRGFVADEMDQRAFGGGASVDLPLWNWNSGRIAEAEAKLAQGRSQLEAAAQDLDSAVIEAQAACSASVKTANRLGGRMVPLAETAASTMDKTYRLGETSLLELIDARRTLLDARRLYLSALLQARTNCNRLGALVGEEPK